MYQENQILTLTISQVRFVQREDTTGSVYKSGFYTSHFVADFVESPKIVADVDQFAPKDWQRKSKTRAVELTEMLAGKKVNVKVVDVLSEDACEGEIVD